MEMQTLQAEVRETRGKGPARQLRMRGLIPAVFYGPGKDPVNLTVDPIELAKALSTPFRRNQVITLEINGAKEMTLVKELAINPVSRQILHADFYCVAEDRAVTTKVPFDTVGRSLGVQKGGKLRKLFRELPVRAFPQNVPSTITLDVAPLDVGGVVKVKDLPLPPGVEVTYQDERRVLFIEFKEAKVEETTQ